MSATTTKSKPATTDETWIPNATFPTKPDALNKPLVMDTWLDFAVDSDTTLAIKATHGIGKTKHVFSWAAKRGLEAVYINLGTSTIGDKRAHAPLKLEDGTIVLDELVSQELIRSVPYVIILDDGRHAMQKVQNEWMPVSCDGTIGQKRPENLKGVILLDNEGALEGIQTYEDPAVADRKVTVLLNANDTGWRYALAEKYKDTNLSKVFRVWDSLNGELRHILSPRCLDHVIYCGLNGLPLIAGLPLQVTGRVRLITTNGDTQVDRTKEILDKIADGLGVQNLETTPDMVRKSIRLAFRDRLTILIQGGPGTGKTALTRAMVDEAGYEAAYYPLASTNPTDLSAPLPYDGTLVTSLARRISRVNPKPFAIIWDEYSRVTSKAVYAQMMEATEEWRICGVPLEGCVAQIALANPATTMGKNMAVTKNNIAQADRFTISIEVSEDDIPANEWLLAKYGDIAIPAIEWYKNDIGPEHTQYITKRTLERFIKLQSKGLPLENGKIYLGDGEFVPVSLVDLEARFEKRPMARLTEIVNNIDEWEDKLRAASETSDVGTLATDQVHQAISLAELSQLRAHKDAVVRLMRFLPPKMKGTFFIGASEDVQNFFIEVMVAMAALG